MALRGFPIDSLPPEVRHKAVQKVKEAMLAAEEIGDAIDDLLREYAKSPYIDPDVEAAERADRRTKTLKELEALYPGRWRVRRKRRARSTRK